MKRSLPLVAIFILFSAAAFGVDRPTAQKLAREILRADGFWDIAATTGFFDHHGPPRQLPFDALQQCGVRGAMLGIGTLTEVIIARSLTDYSREEVPAETNLFRHVFHGAALIQRQLWEFDAAYQAAQKDPRLKIITTAADLEQAFRGQQVAVLLGLDTGACINEDLAALRMYQRLGLRKLALVHAPGTSWADSLYGKGPGDKLGLSKFGQEVVKECNRLGVLVDVSHCSDKTFWDTIAVATKPLIATHSGARAISKINRNLTDEMLRALAAKGGMIGVCGLFDEEESRLAQESMRSPNMIAVSVFLAEKYHDQYQLAAAVTDPRQQLEARKQLRLDRSREYSFMPMPEKNALHARILVDHLDHIIKIVGIDHVGIGTDTNMTQAGYPDLIEEIVTALVQRNYTREQIQKILRGNFVRFFKSVTAGTPSQ